MFFNRLLLTCCTSAVVVIAGCSQKSPYPLGELIMPALELTSEPRVNAIGDPVKPSAGEKDWVARNPRPWKYIVLHSSAVCGDNKVGGFDELGCHFVITNGNGGNNGKVETGDRWKKQKYCAHTGLADDNEYNALGIGICIVGDFTNSLPSQAQLDSLEKLLRFLIWKHKIKISNIISHRNAPHAKTKTNCPGDKLSDHLYENLRKTLVKTKK